jgi:hypothetical protein
VVLLTTVVSAETTCEALLGNTLIHCEETPAEVAPSGEGNMVFGSARGMDDIIMYIPIKIWEESFICGLSLKRRRNGVVQNIAKLSDDFQLSAVDIYLETKECGDTVEIDEVPIIIADLDIEEITG